MRRLYAECRLCPRRCGTNRLEGGRGYCGETAALRLAAASIHRGEEPPITAEGGSGTIFVTGCNLGCSFCQNHQISRGGLGRGVTAEEFAAVCLALQSAGAENVNVVTGSHAVPAVAEGLDAARKAGLTIPALWNSSGYESVEALELLQGRISVWLPDLKTLDSGLAAEYFNAPDYPEAAAAAIRYMARAAAQTAGGRLIVRHLVLPGRLASTKKVLRWFADNMMGEASAAMLSVMTQYTPVQIDGVTAAGPQDFLGEREYDQVLEWLGEFGIEEGFCQELVTGSGWLPDFERQNPFSSELSVPVWTWKTGCMQGK